MDELNVSLQSKFQKKVILLLVSLFVVMSSIAFYSAETSYQRDMQKNLVLKHQVIEQAFSGYLARAEKEIDLIYEDLSFREADPVQALDFLFSHHDILFSGGLDFFFIDWGDGRQSVDPRARVFTLENFQSIVLQGISDKWVLIFSDDVSAFLMYEKSIWSEAGKNLGYLYGFIALNDNLVLASELLGGKQVDGINIYDENGLLLLEERDLNLDLSESVLTSKLPFNTSVEADLTLELLQKKVFSMAPFFKIFPFIVMSAAAHLLFYLLLAYQIKRMVFQPLEKIGSGQGGETLPYSEFQVIQNRNKQNKVLRNALEKRFEQLNESVNGAIIFCSEVTEVERMNSEARALFPDFIKTRTIFDFMPISCHQAIQEALKGEMGVTFELTFKELERVYRWQAYPFINESLYQGLLLVGKDITKEVSLLWQLDQAQPLFLASKKEVDTKAILNELRYLSQLVNGITVSQHQGWLSLILSILDDIRSDEGGVEYLPIGEVFAQESARVIAAMDVPTNHALLDCHFEIGRRVIAVNNHFRSLTRLVFMIVMSNSMSERRLSVRYERSELGMAIMHDMSTRPLFFWMLERLLEELDGSQRSSQSHVVQLNVMVDMSQESVSEELPSGLVVAWIVNDYPSTEAIEGALSRLGVHTETYTSANNFFTESDEISQFDVLLVGGSSSINEQQTITESLKVRYNRSELPIVWLNSALLDKPDSTVFTVSGSPSDYGLYRALLDATAREGVCPTLPYKDKPSWVVVGGSRVSKAIWHTELEKKNVSVLWLTSLSNYHVVLPHHADAVFILLEPQTNVLLNFILEGFPETRFFSLQNWKEMPSDVTLFEMQLPYSAESINLFAQQIMKENYI